MIMYGPNDSISQYRQTHRSTATNNPHRVIALLLAGVIECIHRAESCLLHTNEKGKIDVVGKINAIRSALDIIEGLQLSLDHNAGGEIAGGLEAIYQYCTMRLIEANAKNEVEPLREAARLIGEIESAWAEIAPAAEAADG